MLSPKFEKSPDKFGYFLMLGTENVSHFWGTTGHIKNSWNS
jgi:hypothetical protein